MAQYIFQAKLEKTVTTFQNIHTFPSPFYFLDGSTGDFCNVVRFRKTTDLLDGDYNNSDSKPVDISTILKVGQFIHTPFKMRGFAFGAAAANPLIEFDSQNRTLEGYLGGGYVTHEFTSQGMLQANPQGPKDIGVLITFGTKIVGIQEATLNGGTEFEIDIVLSKSVGNGTPNPTVTSTVGANSNSFTRGGYHTRGSHYVCVVQEFFNRTRKASISLNATKPQRINSLVPLFSTDNTPLVDDFGNQLVAETSIALVEKIQSQNSTLVNIGKGAQTTDNLTGNIKVVEQFPTTSEVSSTLLGIPRAETQLSLFSDVSTLGLDTDSWEVFKSLDPSRPRNAAWENRQTIDGERFNSKLRENINEQALELTAFPVPYTYPWDARNVNNFDSEQHIKFTRFILLGNFLYRYYEEKNEPYFTDFLNPAVCTIEKVTISRESSAQSTDGHILKYPGADTTEAGRAAAFRAIDVWTNTFTRIKNGNYPFTTATVVATILYSDEDFFRVTKYLQETISLAARTNIGFQVKPSSVNDASTLVNAGFGAFYQPGYQWPSGSEEEIVLQTKETYRYQPGRISGFTFGTRTDVVASAGGTIVEWGVENETDAYVFRLTGGNLSIVRKSTVPLSERFLRDERLVGRQETITGQKDRFTGEVKPDFFELAINQREWNGDSLNGNGPTGYVVNVSTVTMWKIEFSWYGAVGARFYAYIPVENGEARWVLVHTIVIENKLARSCLEDPFFRMKYSFVLRNRENSLREQFVYKYGSSVYIDGGDRGNLKQFSYTGDKKSSVYNTFVPLLGIKAKNEILNRDGIARTSRKIAYPSLLNVNASEFSKFEVVQCEACPGFGFTYDNGLLAKTPQNSTTSKKVNFNIFSITGGGLGGDTTQYIRQSEDYLDLHPLTSENEITVAGFTGGNEFLNGLYQGNVDNGYRQVAPENGGVIEREDISAGTEDDDSIIDYIWGIVDGNTTTSSTVNTNNTSRNSANPAILPPYDSTFTMGGGVTVTQTQRLNIGFTPDDHDAHILLPGFGKRYIDYNSTVTDFVLEDAADKEKFLFADTDLRPAAGLVDNWTKTLTAVNRGVNFNFNKSVLKAFDAPIGSVVQVRMNFSLDSPSKTGVDTTLYDALDVVLENSSGVETSARVKLDDNYSPADNPGEVTFRLTVTGENTTRIAVKADEISDSPFSPPNIIDTDIIITGIRISEFKISRVISKEIRLEHRNADGTLKDTVIEPPTTPTPEFIGGDGLLHIGDVDLEPNSPDDPIIFKSTTLTDLRSRVRYILEMELGVGVFDASNADHKLSLSVLNSKSNIFKIIKGRLYIKRTYFDGDYTGKEDSPPTSALNSPFIPFKEYTWFIGNRATLSPINSVYASSSTLIGSDDAEMRFLNPARITLSSGNQVSGQRMKNTVDFMTGRHTTEFRIGFTNVNPADQLVKIDYSDEITSFKYNVPSETSYTKKADLTNGKVAWEGSIGGGNTGTISWDGSKWTIAQSSPSSTTTIHTADTTYPWLDSNGDQSITGFFEFVSFVNSLPSGPVVKSNKLPRTKDLLSIDFDRPSIGRSASGDTFDGQSDNRGNLNNLIETFQLDYRIKEIPSDYHSTNFNNGGVCSLVKVQAAARQDFTGLSNYATLTAFKTQYNTPGSNELKADFPESIFDHLTGPLLVIEDIPFINIAFDRDNNNARKLTFSGGELGLNSAASGITFTSEAVFFQYLTNAAEERTACVIEISALPSPEVDSNDKLTLSFVKMLYTYNNTGAVFLEKRKVFGFDPFPLYPVVFTRYGAQVNNINFKNGNIVTSPSWTTYGGLARLGAPTPSDVSIFEPLANSIEGYVAPADAPTKNPENFQEQDQLSTLLVDKSANKRLRRIFTPGDTYFGRTFNNGILASKLGSTTSKRTVRITSFYTGGAGDAFDSDKVDLENVFGEDRNKIQQDFRNSLAIFIVGTQPTDDSPESSHSGTFQASLNTSEL